MIDFNKEFLKSIGLGETISEGNLAVRISYRNKKYKEQNKYGYFDAEFIQLINQGGKK